MAEEAQAAAAAAAGLISRLTTPMMNGATMTTYSSWMTAAVVAAFATRTLWVNIRSAARKHKLKNEPSLKLEEDENDSDPEVESENECEAEGDGTPAIQQAEVLKPFDAGPVNRSIKL